jgi:hypothetical protein
VGFLDPLPPHLPLTQQFLLDHAYDPPTVHHLSQFVIRAVPAVHPLADIQQLHASPLIRGEQMRELSGTSLVVEVEVWFWLQGEHFPLDLPAYPEERFVAAGEHAVVDSGDCGVDGTG